LDWGEIPGNRGPTAIRISRYIFALLLVVPPASSISFAGEGVAARSATTFGYDEPADSAEVVVADEIQVDELGDSNDTSAPPRLTNFWQPPVDYGWGKWQARVGAILLNRTDPTSRNLDGVVPPAFNTLPGSVNPPTANASDFKFPLSAGVDVALRRPGKHFDLDFRYFGVNQSTATWGPYLGGSNHVYVIQAHPFIHASYGPSSETLFTISNSFGLASAWAVDAQLTSSLQSAEVNVRREITPRVALLAGFRYLQFREALMSREVLGSAPLTISQDLRGQNELFGFQIGDEVSFLRFGNRLSVDLFAKFGVFGNAASSSYLAAITQPGPSPYYRSAEANRGVASFALETGVSANLRLTRRLTLRGGYQFLKLYEVATATSQTPALYDPSFTTRADDSVIYHGATVGLEWGW
jgi:hypothetical protein